MKERTPTTNPICKDRKTMLEMGNAIRTINVASTIPDLIKAEQTQREIIKHLARHKIHVSATQEIQISQEREYAGGNYKIITASAA